MKTKRKAKLNWLSVTVLAFVPRKYQRSPSLGFKNWLFFFTLSWKSNPPSAIIPSIFASFLASRSCWHREYQALPPNRSHWKRLSLQCCMEQMLWSRLRCWAQWHWYFLHFKLFYFPNIIGFVQRIIRFVMRTKPKASYRTVQYEYAYCYTPNIIYIYIYIYIVAFGFKGSRHQNSINKVLNKIQS